MCGILLSFLTICYGYSVINFQGFLLFLCLMNFYCVMSDCRDLQSYLSNLSLFSALESNKFYILVDNRPWLRDLGSRPAHLWQLMVTKVVENSYLSFEYIFLFFNGKKIIIEFKSFFIFYSLGYLLLLTPKAVGRERRERKLLPNQMLKIPRSLRDGSL